MRIAVDAMGGDHAPEALIEGALLAQPQCADDIILIGNEARLSNLLALSDSSASLKVVHAPQVIGMGEAGPVAIRKKRDASLCVAMRLLAENEADAVVSAGNSSAIVAASKYLVGLNAGLRRPAMAVPLPTRSGRVVLLDAGAYAEANSIHLAQSAVLAHAFLKVTGGLSQPRIGLLNIGQEPLKGRKVVQRAFNLLERSRLHFVGNVEPNDIFAGRADAVICDGFVGNVLLKMYEGFSETLLRFLESQVETAGGEFRKDFAAIVDRFKRNYQYEYVGGAPLLGVRKVVVVAHGRSGATAIANAICYASRLSGEKVYERLSEELEREGTLAELRHQNALLMLEQLKSKWGFAHR